MSSQAPTIDPVLDIGPDAAVLGFSGSSESSHSNDVLPNPLPKQRKGGVPVKRSKILVADGDESSLNTCQKYLNEAGYRSVQVTSNLAEVPDLLCQDFPDLLLFDLDLPQQLGIELLDWVISEYGGSRLPILVITSQKDRNLRQAALDLGVLDFIAKPLDSQELLPRVRNTLVSHTYQSRLSQYATSLETTIRRRTNDLEASRREVVYCLGRAAEFRDDITGKHVIRVGKFVGVLARRMGFRPNDVDLLEMAAQLHDIGKIGIPDDILKKPGKLTDEEFRLMKKHCAMGLHILRPIKQQSPRETDSPSSASPLLALAGRIAATHHEKWDGSGYPLGLKGEQIPVEGRLTAVADVFDSLSSERPYKVAFPLEKCLHIIREGSGQHFDPQIVEHFFAGLDEILELQRKYQDSSQA